MGLRLQQIDIPAINLVRTPETSEVRDCLTVSEARDLYLRLKSAGKDQIFVRSAHRNVGYVIQVLGDHPLSAYSTVDAAKFRDWLIDQGMARDTIKRVFGSVRSIINLAIKEQGLGCQNAFSGTFMPDGLRVTKRQPIPVSDIHKIQQKCRDQDDELRWIIALLSDTGMRLGEVIGLIKTNINLCAEIPHITLKPHPWRRLKTPGSERQIPLVGASLWAAKRALTQHTDSEYAFPNYCSGEGHKTNSASAALNKWLRNHAPDGCVVHSFRHSMRDRLRAVECPFDVIDQIGGWSTAGVGSGNGNGYQIKVLYRWMDLSIEPPEMT
ncbi:tyrosine-type recombinase/integrase [bacterium]|nr:tyrosine-type recombinase/integrase [bacterium]